jgi:transcriptional regulator with XRE-family HTH domain
MSKFSEWVDQELTKRNWTRADLSRLSGFSQTALSLVWKGDRNPGSSLCEGIAHAFSYPPEVVFRAAGLLPPADEITEAVSRLNHSFVQLSQRDQDEVQAIIDMKIANAKQDIEQQRAAKRVKTGPLPHLGV